MNVTLYYQQWHDETDSVGSKCTELFLACPWCPISQPPMIGTLQTAAGAPGRGNALENLMLQGKFVGD